MVSAKQRWRSGTSCCKFKANEGRWAPCLHSIVRLVWHLNLYGIHCLTVCAIQLLDQNSFDGLWKPTCLPVDSVSLTVRFRGVFTYSRYTNVHLLTYLLNLTWRHILFLSTSSSATNQTFHSIDRQEYRLLAVNNHVTCLCVYWQLPNRKDFSIGTVPVFCMLLKHWIGFGRIRK